MNLNKQVDIIQSVLGQEQEIQYDKYKEKLELVVGWYYEADSSTRSKFNIGMYENMLGQVNRGRKLSDSQHRAIDNVIYTFNISETA